jgi:site-specific DNA recombinase
VTVRRALIYTRISQDRNGAGLGVGRQLEDCSALADRLRWEVVGHHRDNDVSAYSGRPRPGYRSLLADLETGTANAVLVWHTDRLHRSPIELEDFVVLCERRDVAVQTVQAGPLDLSTPSGRLVARMLGASARYEVEHKSARTKRAQYQAAQAGRWLGGARPFGWRIDGPTTATIDPEEAREVAAATRAVLEGGSLGGIVADLNARGISTTTGRQWSYATLRQMLRRPRNAGLAALNGEILGPNLMPAIVTEQEWRQVCAILTDPSRRKAASNRARWLLAGIARCGTCGQPLRSAAASTRGISRTIYRCRTEGTGHVARSAQPVDEHVATVAVALLRRENLAAMLTPASAVDVDLLVLEANSARARLDEAAGFFASGVITGAQLSVITATVRAELDRLEEAISRAGASTALSPFLRSVDPQQMWDDLTIEQRRAAVRELMEVVILPGLGGKEYRPELTKITPRVST